MIETREQCAELFELYYGLGWTIGECAEYFSCCSHHISDILEEVEERGGEVFDDKV